MEQLTAMECGHCPFEKMCKEIKNRAVESRLPEYQDTAKRIDAMCPLPGLLSGETGRLITNEIYKKHGVFPGILSSKGPQRYKRP